MHIIAKLRSNLMHSELKQRSEFYKHDFEKEESLKLQLNQFNGNWLNIINNVPYYRSLFEQGMVPGKFKNWDQFQQEMPICNRNEYINEKFLRTDQSKKIDYIRVTGGSSGNPLQIPAWKSENSFTRPDQWVGRSWYGIKPEDSCFWLMGGSYFLGKGFKGNLKKYKRVIKDFLLGYYRFHSYNLTRENLMNIADIIIKHNPDYIIGFSAILDNIARVNKDRKQNLKKIKLKAVIATSEIFPFEDSAQTISETFQAPVAMEYGSNETIAIAHTDPSGIFNVFWRNYFIEGVESKNSNLKNILITSLYPRCFPFLRYNIGDQIELLDPDIDSYSGITKFKNVYGRASNSIVCKDGSQIHTAAFSHAIRVFKEIIGYQIIIDGNEIKLNVVTLTDDLSQSTNFEIKHRLSLIHPELGNVLINKVSRLEQTKSGKTPLLIHK